MFGEYCYTTLCAVFKDDFIFVWDMKHSLSWFLEQCFQLSLSYEIGCIFFDIDDILIIPKCMYFFSISLICRELEKMPIYRQSIIFSIISPTPNHKCSSSRQNGFDPSIPPFPITPFLFDRAVLPSSPMRLFNIDFVLSLISMSGKSQSEVLLCYLFIFLYLFHLMI